MRVKTLVAALLALFSALVLVSVAGADHSWNGYHWPSDHRSPAVYSKATSNLYNVPAAVTEWAALGTPIQPAMTANSTGAAVTVSEGYSPWWLGLARVYLTSDGHITKGEVKLNTKLLKKYPAAAADHVLCQELGHIWGLDHNRVGDSSPDDQTCMNDQVNLRSVQYTTPNQHDVDELNLIYAHAEAAAATSNGKSQQGRWVTVHVYTAP